MDENTARELNRKMRTHFWRRKCFLPKTIHLVSHLWHTWSRRRPITKNPECLIQKNSVTLEYRRLQTALFRPALQCLADVRVKGSYSALESMRIRPLASQIIILHPPRLVNRRSQFNTTYLWRRLWRFSPRTTEKPPHCPALPLYQGSDLVRKTSSAHTSSSSPKHIPHQQKICLFRGC